MSDSISKNYALQTVIKGAELYEKELNNKNLLFVCMDKHKKLSYLEVLFRGKHYLHLTGLKIINPDIVSANDFYYRCLKHQLSTDDFYMESDGIPMLKLDVLTSVLNKNLSANMIGDFNSGSPLLYTEKLAGGIKACIGFVKDYAEETYVPNTLLEKDLRKISTSYTRVIATYRKDASNTKYSENVYTAKGIEWDKIQFSEEYSYLPKPV